MGWGKLCALLWYGQQPIAMVGGVTHLNVQKLHFQEAEVSVDNKKEAALMRNAPEP